MKTRSDKLRLPHAADNSTTARLKPRVLVAEGIESDYRLLEIAFGHEYDLLRARDGHEAVEIALHRRPDAVLLDINLPGMNGIEALREIRRHTADLPVIIQSAYAFDTDRRRAEEAGCNGFVTKPLTPRDLAKRLKGRKR
ncbi:response regulator [uncultured Alistipes sp.]|uniref:response regulator n=1 Tax=uncultured Alistipes sp. TaxID=538949 RepID=UPI002612C97B|nr:response regulator [uncultured Alistipes sp.]